MTELEIMERARQYMENLADGVNPLNGEYVPEDELVNNVRMSRCFSYVADVLAQMKGISREEVIRITWENGCRFYGLPVELDKTEV